MLGRLSTALFVAMMLTIQPAFAQENVIILDLGLATDEEVAGALDAATELELVMRAEWEAAEAEAPAAEDAEEPEVYVEEPAAVAEADEPEYVAEAPEAVEADEPEYVAETPEAVVADEPEYVAEAPEAVEAEEPEYIAETPEAVETDEPEYVAEEAEALENRYLLESQRLVALAEEAYEQGDYEAAAAYAREASRYARLSDEYIARQADDADAEAEVVAIVEADAEAEADFEDGYPLPATFTVRSWAVYRDCLWNIAALPEIYGDPHRWPILFNANRHRMPDPNNPDLILPGMVLEIPSIDGEAREGAWQSGRVYRSR